jgi:hypothetical protein
MSQRVLNEAQMADFRHDGYVLVRGLYSPAETADIARWTQEVAGSPEVPGADWKYFERSAADDTRILCRIENFVPFHEPFELAAPFDDETIERWITEVKPMVDAA